MVSLASDHFWSSIAWTAACSFQGLSVLVGVAEAEIDDLDVIVVVHEQVFWLQISVTDAQLVEILDARDYLMQESGSLLFSQTFPVDNVFKELSSSSIFHHQVEFSLCLDNLVKLHNMWMTDYLQNVNFSCYSFHITNISNLVLLKYLDSYFFSSEYMSAHLYFTERPLSKVTTFSHVVMCF